MALDLHIKNNAICRSILKTISKLRDQISLRWQLTSLNSIFVGHSTENIRQSKIKGSLWITVNRVIHGWSNLYTLIKKVECIRLALTNWSYTLYYIHFIVRVSSWSNYAWKSNFKITPKLHPKYNEATEPLFL